MSIFKNLEKITDKISEIILNLKGDEDIKLIIGNGVYPVTSLQDRESIVDQENDYGIDKKYLDDYKKERLIFRRFERIRHITSNTKLSYAYFLLYEIIRHQKVSTITTTNYDLFLDSMLEKFPGFYGPSNFKYIKNPIFNDSQEQRTSSYYFPESKYFQKIPEKSLRNDYTYLWKIHGDLEHTKFENCEHIIKLPPFIIDLFDYTYYNNFDINFFHDNLYFKGSKIHNNYLLNETRIIKETGFLRHYIDLNYPGINRDAINGSIDDLNNLDNTKAILILGFLGHHQTSEKFGYYEELVGRYLLEKINDSNYKDKFFLIINTEQATRKKEIINQLKKIGKINAFWEEFENNNKDNYLECPPVVFLSRLINKLSKDTTYKNSININNEYDRIETPVYFLYPRLKKDS